MTARGGWWTSSEGQRFDGGRRHPERYRAHRSDRGVVYGLGVPARSNSFQRLVLTIHQHLAGDAVVEESAMLPSISIGALREVDVLIRSSVGPYPVLIGVEATARKRPADTTWVEQMIAKHADLPTTKLVLVCEAGFTANARHRAERDHVAVLAREELDTQDPQHALLAQLSTLWPKVVTLKPEQAQVMLRSTTGETRPVDNLPLDTTLRTEIGQACVTLEELALAWARQGQLLDLVTRLRQLDHDTAIAWYGRSEFPPRIRAEGVEQALYLRDEGAPAEWMVTTTAIGGIATVEVGEIPLTHGRLGEIAFATGTGRLGQREVTAVISDGKLTIQPVSASATDETGGDEIRR